MKADAILLDEADKMEVVATKPDKTETLLHSIKPHKGHTLFEANLLTGELEVAQYEKTDILYPITYKADVVKRKKVLAKKDCVYISALNRKNAEAKFFKMINRRLGLIK